MCNHKYRDGRENDCSAWRISEWWAGNAPEAERSKPEGKRLPLDEQGACVFHSKDRNFKNSQGMTKLFREWVAVCSAASLNGCQNADVLDCDDFVFAGEDVFNEGVGEQNIIDLSEVRFGQPCSFQSAEFLSEVWFNYSVFGKRVDFKNCAFHETAHFENATFEARVIFDSCVFSSDAGFRETLFKGAAHFSGCIFVGAAAFNETVFSQHADFSGSSFVRAFFHRVHFLRGVNDGITGFGNTEFKEHAEFRECEFVGETNFASARFNGAEFVDVVFSRDRLTCFNDLEVSGMLTFKNVTREDKMFSHTVAFEVDAGSISGRILFEKANVHYITQLDSLRKLAAPHINKIVFGTGCDKYRLRVEFELPLARKWKPLLEELVETFVIFFDWGGMQPVQVNVEFEYLEKHVLVRYFADADITQEKFAGMIGEKVPAFIELLKDPVGYFEKSQAPSEGEVTTSDQMMLGFDVFRKALALQLGLHPRVKCNELNEENFMLLLQALGKSRHIGKLSINLYQNFVQKDLLSIGTRKYIAGGNIALPPDSKK